MESITPQLVTGYGQQLAERVTGGELSPAYAQNLVSAVNSVMGLASQGQWQSVSPTKGCGIAQRSHVRQEAPQGIERSTVEQVVNIMRSSGQTRGVAVIELARELGLRSKEASLLNAAKVLEQAHATGRVVITDGTKGGRERTIPITHDHQLVTLQRAAAAQGDARSLVPPSQSWAQWRAGGLRAAREALQNAGIPGLHDLRAAYACERYQQLTGHPAPVQGGQAPRQQDRAARLDIARELGHGRINVTVSYLGSVIR